MSGYTERTEATEASPADAPLLEKPFTAQSLLERIRETLGRPVAAAR